MKHWRPWGWRPAPAATSIAPHIAPVGTGLSLRLLSALSSDGKLFLSATDPPLVAAAEQSPREQ